jgi:hypothetical protein
VSALLEQLRQLHADLRAASDRDPEQEVTGVAVPLVDAVLSRARTLVEPADSGLAEQIVDLISVEQIESGEGIRAVDALILVGQLVAALATIESKAEAQEARAVAADKRLLVAFLSQLPPDGPAVTLLRYHGFEMFYDGDDLLPLWQWVDTWTRPTQRFQSEQLAELDAAFREAADQLHSHIVHHVFIRDDGTSRVYPDYDLDWETAKNKFVFDAIRAGNDLLRAAYESYEQLVHQATLKLA